jgi:hypothetical protein
MPKPVCHSCTAPLDGPFKGKSEIYCKYCSDDKGNLKSREECRAGIAHWLRQWQPGVDEAESLRRAEFFMKAMPAWADT